MEADEWYLQTCAVPDVIVEMCLRLFTSIHSDDLYGAGGGVHEKQEAFISVDSFELRVVSVAYDFAVYARYGSIGGC